LTEVLAPQAAKKSSYFKKAFYRGLAGVLPALLTVMVLVWCYKILRDYLGSYVNTVIEWVVRVVGLETAALEINSIIARDISRYIAPADPSAAELQLRPLVGIVLSLVLIYVLGSLISSFVGRKFFPKVEKMALRLPVVKAVYPYARQVTDFFLGERTIPFEKIVALEYPSKGIYSIGFVTNRGLRDVCAKTGKEMIMVFIPAVPAPVTGYVVMVPAEAVIPLSITIDDALRLIITGGVAVSEGQILPRPDAPSISQGKFPASLGSGTPPSAE
jgi:uncharacterized membrane protein